MHLPIRDQERSALSYFSLDVLTLVTVLLVNDVFEQGLHRCQYFGLIDEILRIKRISYLLQLVSEPVIQFVLEESHFFVNYLPEHLVAHLFAGRKLLQLGI